MQYPGLQGAGALGDASTPGTPAGSRVASAHGGTCSLVAVVRGAWLREKGCRLRHRSGGGLPALRDAHGRDRHSAAQRTCAGRVGRPTRRTGGRVGPTTARRGASNRAARWLQISPTSRRNKSRAQARSPAGHRGRVEPRKSLRVVAARNSGRWGGAGGQAPSGPCDPCGRTVLLSNVTPFAFSVIATLPTLTRPQIPEDTNATCHL